MKNRPCLCLLLVVVSAALSFAQQPRAHDERQEAQLMLKDGWELQSSCKVEQSGATMSTPKFHPQGWYAVSVPTTVLAALVKHKVYPDPYYGMNLRSIPGTTYPIGANFADIPMQQDSPFMVPWWYRKEFVIPPAYRGKTIWLDFRGINFRANIWLNGKQIAKFEDIAGTWRAYEFDITHAALPGQNNVLAVEVFSPLENDLALTFVDWNPMPPDKDMGLFRGVEVRSSGPVAVRFPTVRSKVDSPANDLAHLTITALVKNATNAAVTGTLKARIENVEVSQSVDLAPGESKDVSFAPEQFPQLNLAHPQLWWPAQMGTPTLHKLTVEFQVASKVSDHSEVNFGIREVISEVTPNHGRLFSVNGKRILIRGGGWAPDMMLRQDPQRLQDEFRYVRDMGLNAIRLEDHLETEEFFDVADRTGVLIIAGWTCCSPWEHWAKWKPQDFTIAEQSLRTQIYRLRHHPSVLAWLNGSDNPPPPDVEQLYLKVEKELSWPNPIVSSATAQTTPVTGESGTKMTGPYDYIAPGYWEQDSVDTIITHQECNPGGCGGAYGLNLETSMGPAVPPIESIRAMLPKEHWWPIDNWWSFHAGGGHFEHLDAFADALNARYGQAANVEDFAAKSQLMTYEGVRAMYEAYSRNKYVSTGVIQWMLDNAWPSIIWHLYDYYLRPAGGYFGAKKATEALHPLYGYDDRSIWVVSSQYEDAKGLKLSVKMLNLDMKEVFAQEVSLDAPADSTNRVLTLPEPPDLSPTYFLLLRLQNSDGKLAGSNFYWLSTKQETLDWSKSNWYLTPTQSYADYTALSQLPKVKLKVTSQTDHQDENSITQVTLENPSKTLAFFIRLKLTKGTAGPEVLPVLWEDNYISLLPGERREVSASYRAIDLAAAKAEIEVSGWNVVAQ